MPYSARALPGVGQERQMAPGAELCQLLPELYPPPVVYATLRRGDRTDFASAHFLPGSIVCHATRRAIHLLGDGPEPRRSHCSRVAGRALADREDPGGAAEF